MSRARPERLPLDRDARPWRRGIAHLAAGPLARLFAHGPELLDPGILAALWTGAIRETTARLALASVRERLLDGTVVGDELRVELATGPLRLPLRRRGAFELHRVALDVEGADLDPRIDDPLGLSAELGRAMGLDPSHRARVDAELRDSIANLAQARLATHLRDRVASVFADDPRMNDPEHFVTDGHPWHPMTRTRLGLTRAEVVRHAADQLATTALPCFEIPVELARISGDWSERSEAVFGPANPGFVRLPVHPAAAARARRLVPELVAAGHLRPVPTPPRVCRSLLSLRTVELDDAVHLKLACPMHTTSARRGVSPMSVHNGPVVSQLIAAIQRRDPETRALELMPEPAAVGLEPRRVGPHAGEIGVIWRVVPSASAGEQAWVCAALGERWPGTQQCVLEFACAGYPGGPRERLEALIHAWLERLVPPALRLFSHHGVVLEVHAQNTLARVAQGRLLGLRVRDLGGIRIHAPRLARHPGPRPNFAPDSFIVSDDLDEVRGKLEHTLFHAHLGHLFEVAESLGLDAAWSWAQTRARIDACYQRWREAADPELRERLGRDHAALTRPRVRAKALLSMRLVERSSDYDYTEVDNVLSQVSS